MSEVKEDDDIVELQLTCKIKMPIKYPIYPYKRVKELTVEKFGKTFQQACDEQDKELINKICMYKDELQIDKDYYEKRSEYLNMLEDLIPNDFKVPGCSFSFIQIDNKNLSSVFKYGYEDWNSPALKDDPLEKSSVEVVFTLPYLDED